jgi:hypothetical protein
MEFIVVDVETIWIEEESCVKSPRVIVVLSDFILYSIPSTKIYIYICK